VKGFEDAQLRIYLLGRFAVDYQGKAIPAAVWKRRRPVDLLTSLALASGHVMHREEIIDRLWPDKDLDAGANNLYRTLHDLRKATGDDVVRVERGAIHLHESAWVDVVAFEEGVSSGKSEQTQRVLPLYQGDLLADDPYSEHIQPRRIALRQRFVDAAIRLSRDVQADLDQRISILRRLLEIDASMEEAHRLLMQALAEAGRPKEAVEQFRLCTEALREHLEAAPSTKTQELLKRIKGGAFRPSSAAPAADNNWSRVAERLLGSGDPRTIRGRSAERKSIEEFAGSGQGSLVIIGEAGAGKTRMAVECARLCAESGAIVLAGLGYEFEGAAPYTPFVDAWTDVLRILPGSSNPFLSFEPSGGSAQEDRLRLFQAVEQSLAEIAGKGKACILIEDLQQADESSLHLFHHLVRASRHLPLQIIGTIREEDVHAGNALHMLLGSIGRERQTTKMALPRLNWDATRDLLADLWGKEPERRAVDSIYRLAGGNPFYTEEVAVAFEQGGEFSPSSDLMQTIRARVSRLGEDPERLLLAAAVQGARFDFDVAHRAVGMETGAALDALDVALGARVIEEQEEYYRFRHALMREALYESLGRARTVFMHRATAEALEAAQKPGEPEVLAFHHHAAGNLEQALPHTLKAISNAQSRLGFGEAVGHSRRALEIMSTLGHPVDETFFKVLHQLGGMQVALGDLDEAVEALDRAAALKSNDWEPTPEERCSAKRLAGLALIESGDLESAEVHLDAALEALGDSQDAKERCNIYYLYAQLRWHQSRHEESFELAQKCLAVAEKANDLEAISKGYEMLALACHSLGEWKKGRDYEEQRREVAEGTLDVASAFDVHL
jgi:DNA-binding SARP family transcriptional activator/predicted negative regulator of RcsB-dependent stress response